MAGACFFISTQPLCSRIYVGLVLAKCCEPLLRLPVFGYSKKMRKYVFNAKSGQGTSMASPEILKVVCIERLLILRLIQYLEVSVQSVNVNEILDVGGTGHIQSSPDKRIQGARLHLKFGQFATQHIISCIFSPSLIYDMHNVIQFLKIKMK
jgi:hypothetical protein